ncbi:cell division protein FtsQ/DivIB [Rhodonellum sp.]|uniref:cell division protein FtsQ/DivIB n=1 Tax=Rhodonellum sp. TaxID=2231180 RepID=UPI002727B079|nr:cell division protein [Rhodonellum sp.]MDO9553559.1 cell division protein [Rhodonellum sp.]
MKTKLIKTLGFSLLGLVLLVFIGFVEKKGAERKFSEMSVQVKGIADVYFVDEKEILDNLKAEFQMLSPGMALSEIDFQQVELKVESHPFVKKAEVYGDMKGNIWVEIQQHQPMARIVRPMAADGYISTEGQILPTSPKYTTRVLILEGDFAEELLEADDLSIDYQDLLGLVEFIFQDPFWNAQITSLEIDNKGDIKMHQQVGNQVIEFGDAEDIAEKFEKISLFYDEIIPSKGWNAYSRVNVKYKDQIICE